MENDAIFSEAQTAILAEFGGTKRMAIPWEMILDMLMKLLGGCDTKDGAELHDRCQSAGPFVRGRARQAVRSIMPNASWETQQSYATKMLSAGAKAAPEKLEALAAAT